MNTSDQNAIDKIFISKALEATIRIGVVVLLAIWSFQIFKPFLAPVLWGIIIAIASYSGYSRLKESLGGRDGLAATVFTLLALTLLITPTVMLSQSVLESAQTLSQNLKAGNVEIPPPPESVAGWPIIGERVNDFWSLASENLKAATDRIQPQLEAFSSWLVSTAAGAGLGILQFVIAIIIAGVLLAHATGGYQTARAIFCRLADERGEELVDLAGNTVRSVARGILGIALIQSLLAGVGMIVVGVPAAGLWALLVLLLAVVQLPALLILGPVIVYVFTTASTTTAVIFMIWSILVAFSDSVLKPLLLGRGVDVPMLVIFIGAIGGMILNGIIGLFVGPIILAITYTLFIEWLSTRSQTRLETSRSDSLPSDDAPTK